MNCITAVALSLSLSCVGSVAFAGVMTPKTGDIAAAPYTTDLSVVQVKGTSKGKTTPVPKPKPVAPRPSLYSGPDYDNVLGLGNYFVVK
jgi:hypothetical protein